MNQEVIAELQALMAKVFERYPNVISASIHWSNNTVAVNLTSPAAGGASVGNQYTMPMEKPIET